MCHSQPKNASVFQEHGQLWFCRDYTDFLNMAPVLYPAPNMKDFSYSIILTDIQQQREETNYIYQMFILFWFPNVWFQR